jgi:hypothetical protein
MGTCSVRSYQIPHDYLERHIGSDESFPAVSKSRFVFCSPCPAAPGVQVQTSLMVAVRDSLRVRSVISVYLKKDFPIPIRRRTQDGLARNYLHGANVEHKILQEMLTVFIHQ